MANETKKIVVKEYVDEELNQYLVAVALSTDAEFVLLSEEIPYEINFASESINKIILFIAKAEDVADEWNFTFEVDSSITDILEELREEMKIEDEKTMKRCSN